MRQTWLGFSLGGNSGRGLGRGFAAALNGNLNNVFRDCGAEKITHGSHLEKLCLIKDGVGKDTISDFTTNLIRLYLLEFTQAFARKYIATAHRKRVAVSRVRFNYQTESWETAEFALPWHSGDYVLLVPKDLLTRDETWINKHDLIGDCDRIPDVLPNEALRAQVDNYFRMMLPKDAGRKDEREAAAKTIREYPELIDGFIKLKEDSGDEAESVSAQKVRFSQQLYHAQFRAFVDRLESETAFYQVAGISYDEAMQRVLFMKDVIENKRAHRIFYVDGKPIRNEDDLQILYRFAWYGAVANVSREVNDGRGPADFLVSMGAKDKTVVEMKAGSNTQLKRNLKNQAEIYQKASNAQNAIKVILYFSESELARIRTILKELDLVGNPHIVLIDARMDNKPAGSRA